MKTSTEKAPTLFGKRMRSQVQGSYYSAVIEPLHERIWVECIDSNEKEPQWFAERGCHRITRKPRSTPQAAARDAERYLRRLHTALGKVVGS